MNHFTKGIDLAHMGVFGMMTNLLPATSLATSLLGQKYRSLPLLALAQRQAQNLRPETSALQKNVMHTPILATVRNLGSR